MAANGVTRATTSSPGDVHVSRVLRILAALLLLVVADVVIVTVAALATLCAAWVSLTSWSASFVLRLLFSKPVALLSHATPAPDELGAATVSIGLGAFLLFGGLIAIACRDLTASPTTSVRPALLGLLVRGVLITILVPVGAVTAVWAARLMSLDRLSKLALFLAGGLVGLGAVALCLLALQIASTPQTRGILRGRTRDD